MKTLTKEDLLGLGYRFELSDTYNKPFFVDLFDEGSEDFETEEACVAAASADAVAHWTLSRCDSCGKLHTEETVQDAKLLTLRTEPGGTVPSGECVECGALCYPLHDDLPLVEEDGTLTDAGYVRAGGLKCPFCGSEEIEGGAWNADAGYATQEMSCNDCDEDWLDQYQLAGYTRN